MYLKFFNLKAKPFEISPDPKFLWLGEKHKEGLASLKYGILTCKGFMAVIGDVGTGKTTLLNALARSFDEKYIFARIPDPSLEELDFFNFTASAFEMDKRFLGKGDFLTELTIFLKNAHRENKEVILVVDEAQQTTPELLEDIRLISNIEKPEKKLINIIFSGQINFSDILNRNFALRTRLAISYKMEPLTERETDAYITHRLNVAGCSRRIFSSNAIHEIYSLSNGNPRQINIICDLALLLAYTTEAIKIEPEIIRESAKRTIIPTPKPKPVAEYPYTQAIVPVSQSQNRPLWGLSRAWRTSLTRIKSAFSLRRVTYVAPIPLIIALILIGMVFYPDHFFSSISRVQSMLKQAVSGYSEPRPDAASHQAQVVNVMPPAQSDPQPEASVTDLENEKKTYDQLVMELETQSALIADLRQKLDKARAEQTKLQKYLHINRQATALLKTQVKEINSQ